jgi:hypothetical protein
MTEFEPWMIRTALVISGLFLLDGALYAVHVWQRRRWSTAVRPLPGIQHFAEATQRPESRRRDAALQSIRRPEFAPDLDVA